jgi:tetratricopeptide (TPR) repeat protein
MRRLLLFAALAFVVQGIVPQSQAQLRKANRELDRGNTEEALSLANEVLEEEPDNHKVWDLLARIHGTQASTSPMGEYLMHVEAMLEAYGKVVELRPQEESDIGNRITIFYMQTFNKGIEEFNNARAVLDDNALQAEHYRNSAKHFHASAMALPDSVGAYVNWAYALLGAGDELGSVEPMVKALDYGGPDEVLYDLLARVYLTNGMETDALPVLEEAVEAFPANADLQNYLLNAYAATGQNDRALEQYAGAVADNPDNAIYRYNYGSLLLQAERFDDAIEQLLVAVNLDEAYVDAYYNLGAAYINKANAVQQRITALDDDRRARRDEISEEEEQDILAKIDELAAERRGLYETSIDPLESARRYAEMEEGRSAQEICAALFQAYAQTGQEDKATALSECAGM